VLLLLCVLLGVAEAVPLLLPVGLAVALLLPELLAVGLPDRAWLLLTDTLAPLLREAVALPETVELLLTVLEGVGAAVPVPVTEEVPEPVAVALPVGDRLLLLLSLPVEEGLTPLLRELVGVAEREELRLCVLLGVALGVPLPVWLSLLVPVALLVGEGEEEGLRLTEAETEALAPRDREAAALPD
jgi:hypothetical protein